MRKMGVLIVPLLVLLATAQSGVYFYLIKIERRLTKVEVLTEKFYNSSCCDDKTKR